MNPTAKKILLLTSILCGSSAFVSASAQAQAYYEGQSGSAAMNYQPYYVAQAPSPAPQPAPMTSTSTSSSDTAYTSMRTSGEFFAPSGERIVSDPLYLPLQGQFYGTTAYTFRTTSYKSYNYTGAENTRDFNYNDSLVQTMAYGATDDLEFRVSESFEVSGTQVDHQLTGTTTEANANGFTDPTFGVTYRAVDQRHNEPIDLDLLLNYAPNMLDASNAGGGHDGSENPGGQVVTLESVLGREMKGFTIDGLMGASYNGKREYETLSNNDINTNGGYWNYFAGIQTQTRLTDRFSINGDIRYNGYDNYTAANQTTGETWVGQTANNVDFTVALNYHFIPNRLVGQLSYDNFVYTTDAKFNNYSIANTGSTNSYQNSNTFGVRLLYTFD